jgi:uncharacterized protein (TIGR03437 family)
MRAVFIGFILVSTGFAAQPNRILSAVDARRPHVLPNSVHRLAQAQFDLGAVDPAMQLDHVQLLFTPSAEQQQDLDQLLKDQQNPSSPNFRKWLSPGQYADRFGLSASDQSKVIAWLVSEGLTVHESSQGRNWVAFSGSAAQISKAFHTSIHRYQVNGQNHFANATAPSVPEALAGIAGGFLGLNDFNPKPALRATPVASNPDLTSGKSHYLVPEDFATIYNLNPLYTSGYDGTGQSIAIVGESGISLTDIRGFRTRFGLPTNDPKLIPYGTDPGLNDTQFEANLDVEWSGAIAPKATVYYVYGANVFTAVNYAVSFNLAPVISISFGGCEIDDAPFVYRTVLQQANAQGITILNSSGDSGAGSCDVQGIDALATHGRSVAFPSNLPEVTAVGGTMFDDASGTWWAARNSVNGGSALSYIPEVAWNENSVSFGLGASGGGPSRFFTKPDWQTGPGVPGDGARDVPDVSLSASVHDGYLVTYQGANSLYVVGGTSASAPSMAGIVSILNQYVVKQGFQKTAGLGNINPQLYRLAQAAPAVFHDITAGNNIVPCSQGSPDCLTGAFGYQAGPGYDLVTGLGSVDANAFVTSWNTPARAVVVTLTSSATKTTANDSVTLTATVAAASGTGTPTGTVSFFAYGIPLGSATLASVGGLQTATVTFPGWMLSSSNTTIHAQYLGDAGFSAGSASARVQLTLPTGGVSAVIPTLTNPVYPVQTGQKPTWHVYITLRETAGVPAAVTGLTVDGIAQPLTVSFRSVNIPASGTLMGDIVFTNVAPPETRTIGITGLDASGQTWTRQVPVRFLTTRVAENFNVWATPLTMQQNPSAPASCQWSQEITLDEIGGDALSVVFLERGSINISNQIASIFGTTHLAPWGSLHGTLCWSGVTAPAQDQIFVNFADEFGNTFGQTLNVSFTGPSPTPAQLTVSPASISVKPSAVPIFQPGATLSVNLSDKTQSWTAAVYPFNRTTTWLQLSEYSGIGPATIGIQTNGAGFGPGVYRATIVIQSPNAVPQSVSVPVMFVNGVASSGAPIVTSLGNALSFTPTVSPGSLMAIYGSQLSNLKQSATSLPLGLSMAGVSATVNGWPAPILYTSPTQLNVQVPYEAGSGPAVLGINNNGQIGGYLFQISPAAPGILSDGNGNILGATATKPGSYSTLYVTGVGDVSPAIMTGDAVPRGTSVRNLPLPLLPLSVSVGGTQALIQFAGVTPGVVGLVQVNFQVPTAAAAGTQPVVVTVNNTASAPANLEVTAP